MAPLPGNPRDIHRGLPQGQKNNSAEIGCLREKLQQMQTTASLLSAYTTQLKNTMNVSILELFGKDKSHCVRMHGKQYFEENIQPDGDIMFRQILSAGSTRTPEALKISAEVALTYAEERRT